MKPKDVTLGGTRYTLRAPTGGDWLAVSELPQIERTLELLIRCVTIEGRPAFHDRAAVEGAALALIQALDEALASLMVYEIPDPT